MKKKIFSVACIAIFIGGVTAFTSCDKENQTSLNSSHQITKSDNVSYNSLVEDHDYSISIEGENINYTAYGRLNCDVESVREVVDGVEYKGLRYITVDENIHSISKINENSLEVKIDDLISAGIHLTLENVVQNGDTLYFSLKRNGEHIANCRLKIPQGIGDFMDMMPLNFDENAGITSNAPSRLRWVFRFIVPITSNDNSEVQSEGDKCRKYMLEQARICNDGGGVFSASHRLNHDGCSHTCTR